MTKITNTQIREQIINNNKPFPFVLSAQNSYESKSNYKTWLKEHKNELKDLLQTHDAILFRNFPIESPVDFEEMLEIAEFPEMSYIGGAAPRTQVTKGRILTANESPATETIPFHHEMAQTPNPPNHIFFCCDTPADSGGATSIVQSHIVQKEFFNNAPELAQKIEKEGVRYVRVMPEVTDKKSAIGRSWKETFRCNTKEEAEKEMKRIGMDWEWQESGDLKTISGVLPAIKKDHLGRKNFFNSIVAAFKGWNDQRNTGEKSVMIGDHTFLSSDKINKINEIMQENAVNFKWQKGDVLWLNNNTVLHARQSFTGYRKVLTSIS